MTFTATIVPQSNLLSFLNTNLSGLDVTTDYLIIEKWHFNSGDPDVPDSVLVITGVA